MITVKKVSEVLENVEEEIISIKWQDRDWVDVELVSWNEETEECCKVILNLYEEGNSDIIINRECLDINEYNSSMILDLKLLEKCKEIQEKWENISKFRVLRNNDTLNEKNSKRIKRIKK